MFTWRSEMPNFFPWTISDPIWASQTRFEHPGPDLIRIEHPGPGLSVNSNREKTRKEKQRFPNIPEHVTEHVTEAKTNSRIPHHTCFGCRLFFLVWCLVFGVIIPAPSSIIDCTDINLLSAVIWLLLKSDVIICGWYMREKHIRKAIVANAWHGVDTLSDLSCCGLTTDLYNNIFKNEVKKTICWKLGANLWRSNVCN